MCVYHVYIFVGSKNLKFTVLVGTNSRYEDKNHHPDMSEGIFETQNEVLVSELGLGIHFWWLG